MSYHLLSNNEFWIVNKQISRYVGVEAALLLSDLISKQTYFEERDEIDEEGFFYNTAENIEKDTTLSYHIQKKCLRALYDAGFIEAKLKGIPAKLHFKICKIKISNFLNTEVKENLKQEFNKVETNNNKAKKTKAKKINPEELFSGAEVKSLPEEILLYLNERKDGRGFDVTPVNLSPIKTRLKEKYSLEDCKKVIDAAVIKWGNDTERKGYIRPSTLFGKNFNAYLVEADGIIKKAHKAGSGSFTYEPTDTAILNEE